MRRLRVAVGLVVLALASAPSANADPGPLPPLPSGSAASAPVAPPTTPTTPTAPQPSPAPANPTPAVNGIAVVALPGAADAAWPLAQAVYSTPSLRPYGVDESHARVLCGEPPPDAAPRDLHDLADTVAAIRGDDAASRAILGDVARRLNVRALVVVRTEGEHTVARVFVADGGSFDAASYAPDEGSTFTWTAAVRSLARSFGGGSEATAAAPLSAPALATHEGPALDNEPPKKKAFYESGWFWGAVGAAAFAGGAVFFATRDNGPTTIHLEMQVPH
jgi:hypothetical protein